MIIVYRNRISCGYDGAVSCQQVEKVVIDTSDNYQ